MGLAGQTSYRPVIALTIACAIRLYEYIHVRVLHFTACSTCIRTNRLDMVKNVAVSYIVCRGIEYKSIWYLINIVGLHVLRIL